MMPETRCGSARMDLLEAEDHGFHCTVRHERVALEGVIELPVDICLDNRVESKTPGRIHTPAASIQKC